MTVLCDITILYPNFGGSIHYFEATTPYAILTFLWADKWMCPVSLQVLFSYIFALAQLYYKTVANLWDTRRIKLVLKRYLNDLELPRVTELYKNLENFHGLQSGEDFLWWSGHSKFIFKVRDKYTLVKIKNLHIHDIELLC